MLTAQTLAMRLQGREYRSEMGKAEEAEAKAAGLVVVFGASDDLMEFRGAIDEEVGAYEGTTVALTDKGLCKNECESEDCPAHIAAVEAARKIEAKWCPDIGISWAYATDIPHFIFEVMEDDEVYCQGIVFALADAAPEASEPQQWIDDPHDIEQGRMLNPAWLKAHGLTAADVSQPTQAEAPSEREALPCPFCGNHDVSDGEILTEEASKTYTQSECLTCGAVGPRGFLAPGQVDYGNAVAISAWNKRVEPEATQPTQAEDPCYICGASRDDHPWEADPRGGRRRGACPDGPQPTQAEAPSEPVAREMQEVADKLREAGYHSAANNTERTIADIKSGNMPRAVIGAALATQQAVQGEAAYFLAARLRRVAKLAGVELPDEPDAETAALAGVYLGMVARALSRAATGQVERDREDAENYRWLRAQHESGKATAFAVFAPDSDDENTATHYAVGCGRGELDAAIRAARSSEGGE